MLKSKAVTLWKLTSSKSSKHRPPNWHKEVLEPFLKTLEVKKALSIEKVSSFLLKILNNIRRRQIFLET